MSKSSSATSNAKPLCRYFTSNICFKGDLCEFSHDRYSKPDMVCRYYLQGNCVYGSKCRYDHIRQNRENEHTIISNALMNTSQATFSNIATASKNNSKKMSADSKVFMPASVPKTNPWENTSSLNNFHANIGQELELIGQEEEGCSTSIGQNTRITDDEMPLCPYFVVGLCEDAFCRFIHGLPCEMCGLNALHPYNELQRKNHHRECLAEHEKEMEEAFAHAKSAEMQCGICMEIIVDKENSRFGILQNCAHCFCLDCIRKWRNHNDEHIETKTVRACPECRVHSHYVIPSKVWIDDKAEKDKLVKMFHENTKKIQCKYVKGGDVDKCPFGNKCFYKHQMPDGTIVEGKSPSTLRKDNRRRFDLIDFINFSSDEESDFDWY